MYKRRSKNYFSERNSSANAENFLKSFVVFTTKYRAPIALIALNLFCDFPKYVQIGKAKK